jgi:TetR/AcrR family transcriptional regulator
MQTAKQITTANCEHRLRDAQATKLKLVNAALLAFSTQGYDASSTRSIETKAGVKRGLINYHFGSKKALWQAAAEHLMSITERDLGTALSHMNQIDEAQQLRFFVRAYVKFCAKHPELNRLMIQEGMAQDWRLTWLLERSVRPWYAQVCRVFNRATQLGIAPQMDAHHFYYALTGAATLMFSNAAEATALSGKNPLDPATVDAHADAVANLFTSIRKPL